LAGGGETLEVTGMPTKRFTLILVTIFTGLAVTATVFERSFLIGRRSFNTAEGSLF
jgi:hypothetical protein